MPTSSLRSFATARIALVLLITLGCGGVRRARVDAAEAVDAEVAMVGGASGGAANDSGSGDRSHDPTGAPGDVDAGPEGQPPLPDAAPFVPREANRSPLGGVVRPCAGLECHQGSCVMGACQQTACPGGARTTLTGRVFDPAGRVALHNVMVYIPNAPLAPFAAGPSCQRCDTPVSGQAIASALTDTKGGFVIDNVPVGSDVPLVLQIGKWRRQIVIPTVTACTNTQIPNALTRLPRNQSEGDIPQMALTTGGADPMECLLRKLGLDDAEFTTQGGSGRVHLYAGSGGTSSVSGAGALASATSLWSSPANLRKYDVVVLACEGGQFPATKLTASRLAMQDYTAGGGRVFASHFHNYWLQAGPSPWPEVATWNANAEDLVSPISAKIDRTFPKGRAMAEWLVEVGGSQVLGDLTVIDAQHVLNVLNTSLAQRWIYAENVSDKAGVKFPAAVQHFTFNTPLGAPEPSQCGRVVYSDLHISGGDAINRPFPQGCTTTVLSPQEKVLAYMLFDLVSCVEHQQQTPQPPDIQ